MQLRNLDNEIKKLFIKNGFKIIKEKIQIEKSEAKIFIKCMRQNLFITTCVHIYHLAQY